MVQDILDVKKTKKEGKKMVVKDSLNDVRKISYVEPSCEELHITKTLSTKDMVKLLTRCKRIKVITLSKTTKERLGVKTKELLKKKNIALIIKSEQGRPIDIPIAKLKSLIEMHKDFSYRELEEKLKVPKSTLHYILKKSKKRKLKDGKKIIYLK